MMKKSIETEIWTKTLRIIGDSKMTRTLKLKHKIYHSWIKDQQILFIL